MNINICTSYIFENTICIGVLEEDIVFFCAGDGGLRAFFAHPPNPPTLANKQSADLCVRYFAKKAQKAGRGVGIDQSRENENAKGRAKKTTL
jgi:hypothetical protein